MILQQVSEGLPSSLAQHLVSLQPQQQQQHQWLQGLQLGLAAASACLPTSNKAGGGGGGGRTMGLPWGSSPLKHTNNAEFLPLLAENV